MSATALGRIHWDVKRDKDGHRDYSLRWLVESTDPDDGPATILAAAGLATVGSTWSYGNDVDSWAFCLPEASCTPVVEKEKGQYWFVDQTFSTKPMRRCNTTDIENPLSEPDRLSGSFLKENRSAAFDKNGDPILTSSLEWVRGEHTKRSFNQPTVKIERNVLTNPLSTFAPMVDTVNDATLWGMPKRSVKLANVSWARKLYGVCTYYYVVTYDFVIDYGTFDRYVLDEGTKVLACGGNKNNPQHFVQYKDINGENSYVILDGNGEPWDGTGTPGKVFIEFYDESNFLLLGIPTSL